MTTHPPGVPRRGFLGASLSAGAALACRTGALQATDAPRGASGRPTLVGSRNALAGMREHYAALEAGADPLDVAIDVVKVTEADPSDHSVGLGGLPNEDCVVQLDAAVMYGPTHNSGAVACIENILHPSEVARLVMERTDHCLIVGPGAYRFARQHGHPHTELLTERAREIWLEWRESMSERDDRLTPPEAADGSGDDSEAETGWIHVDGEKVALRDLFGERRPTGTIHCSALASDGRIACTTTTSGLSWKIPGRVGDSPIVGSGLYCDQEAGSAGATGRGEAAVLAAGSFAIVELMRQGRAPVDAGLEVLRRVSRQAKRASAWNPALWDAEHDRPGFNLRFYVLGLDGTWAGVALRDGGKGEFAVADADGGPRLAPIVPLYLVE